MAPMKRRLTFVVFDASLRRQASAARVTTCPMWWLMLAAGGGTWTWRAFIGRTCRPTCSSRLHGRVNELRGGDSRLMRVSGLSCATQVWCSGACRNPIHARRHDQTIRTYLLYRTVAEGVEHVFWTVRCRRTSVHLFWQTHWRIQTTASGRWLRARLTS